MFVVYIVIRCRLQPELGPALPPEERDIRCAEKLRCCAPGCCRWAFLRHDGAVRQWLDQPGRKLCHRRHDAFLAAVLKGRMTGRCSRRRCARRSASPACSCGSSLAALGFGAVFDGLGAVKAIESLFTEQLGLDPWMILILMQLSSS